MRLDLWQKNSSKVLDKILKVCGITSKTDLSQLPKEVSHLGFIFYKKSPREVDQVIDVPEGVKKVGVFVNPTKQEVEEAISKHQLDVLQFHGTEEVDFVAHFRATGKEIWKVIALKDTYTKASFDTYNEVCDKFLIDYKSAKYGGVGEKFNWELLNNYHLSKPIIIAGGISSQDANEVSILFKNFPFVKGVDINSKFEVEPGLKNIKLISSFTNKLTPQ